MLPSVPPAPVRRQPFGSRKQAEEVSSNEAEPLLESSEALPFLEETSSPLLEEQAAARIEAHQRGARERYYLQQKKAAALTIEKISRGHSLRAHSMERLPRKREPIKPVRVVICGCKWSGAAEQVNKLSWKLPAPSFLFEAADRHGNGSGLTGRTRSKLNVSTSWVLDGSLLSSAVDCKALLSLPLPPTHWVLCTVDDAVAEDRALAAVQTGDAARQDEHQSWVREQLRAWKLQMVDVYGARPASEFIRVDTSTTSATDVHWQILNAVLLDEMDTDSLLEQKTLQDSPSAGHEPRSPAAEPVGGVPLVEMSEDMEVRSTSSRSPIAAKPFTISRASTEKSIASALERVDDITEDWRSRSLLARLSKFSSSFLREHLSLDGKLLLSVQGATFSPAFTANWVRPMALRCVALVVDSSSEPLPDVKEVRTRTAQFQSSAWWNDELCLTLPRAVMLRADVFVQITVQEADTSAAIAQTKQSLTELAMYSNQSRMWSLLDEDWPLWSMANGDESETVSDANPVGKARIRSQLVDLVTVFDELMVQPRHQAMDLGHKQLSIKTQLESELSDIKAQLERALDAQEENAKALAEAHLERVAEERASRMCDAETQAVDEAHSRGKGGDTKAAKKLKEELRVLQEDHEKEVAELMAEARTKEVKEALLLQELSTADDAYGDALIEVGILVDKIESAEQAAKKAKVAKMKGTKQPPVGVMPHLEKQRRKALADQTSSPPSNEPTKSKGFSPTSKELTKKPPEARQPRTASPPKVSPTKPSPPKASSSKPSASSPSPPKKSSAAKTSTSPPRKPSPPRKASPSPKKTTPPKSKSNATPTAKTRPKDGAKRGDKKGGQGKSDTKEQQAAKGLDEAKTKLKDAMATSLNKVQDLFKLWDVDGSGSIDKEEFRKAVKALGLVTDITDEACDAAFDEFDYDGGGSIEYSEYIRYSLRDAIARNMARVMDLFKKFDTDHSGQVDKKEFRKAIGMLGFDAPTADIDHLFDEVDTSHDGEIEFKELNKVLRVRLKA
jgi:calcium-binding protein CML